MKALSSCVKDGSGILLRRQEAKDTADSLTARNEDRFEMEVGAPARP